MRYVIFNEYAWGEHHEKDSIIAESKLGATMPRAISIDNWKITSNLLS